MRTISTLLLVSILSAAVSAQGPDVIVGSLNGMDTYGTNGSGIYAYSIGTDSCNIGTLPLNWVSQSTSSSNQHPVIGQNFYRLKNGRFEQIGMSWLKHGFTALANNLCATCQSPGTGQVLGINCSDPYSSGLNGSQSNGPRNEVNASTGYFPIPFSGSYPAATATIGRRIQCAAADVNPALNAGALYYAEGQYVAADDAAAGNKNNNASYRPMTFAAGGNFIASFTSGTVQQQPAILAWQAADAAVVIENVDWVNDGRFIIGKKVTSLGGGLYHYEFAIHNLNSDRSGGGFTVELPLGTTISSPGFKDISYHSGEPYSGTDWTNTINGASINWSTEPYATSPNANALRWGTLYNFWFDATAPAELTRTIHPFKCLTNPAIPSPYNYVLNTAAAFDNPAIAVGTNGPTGTSGSSSVPMGFTFNFYGNNYSTVYLMVNGLLSFTPGGPGAGVHTNRAVPASSVPNEAIFGYGDDLSAVAGQIKYETQGVAPNRRFIAHWNGVTGPSGAENFKIILDETTNKITSTIVSSAGGGASATRGIERKLGLDGVAGSFNTAGSAVAGTSWTYTPIISIQPSADLTISGSTAPNGTLEFYINSNAPAGSVVVLVASFDPGPTDFGAYGIMNIGFTPGLFVPLADGGGVLLPADPADVTDSCGDLNVVIPLGPDGVPPGLSINVQGGVIAPTSVPAPPNTLFHITQMQQVIT